jgi:hypothetical protein
MRRYAVVIAVQQHNEVVDVGRLIGSLGTDLVKEISEIVVLGC